MGSKLLLIAVGVIAVSGVPGLVLGRRTMLGQWVGALLNVAGSVMGLAGLIAHFFSAGPAQAIVWSWSLPIGRFAAGVDDLSAIFLIPMLLISALGSIYGLEYWKQPEHPGNGRKLRFCWGLLAGGMMLVVMARDGVLLLMAWEIMALAAFFLVATEDRKPEVRRAAWIYLVATHFGSAFLLATFGLLRYWSGSFDLWPAADPLLPQWLTTAIFITGIIGFGLKAGLMPLHVWLPGGHANAPSHVSAMLSGVMLKAGVYGIIRVAALVPHPPIWWGATLLVAGVISGIFGIAFAVAQQDFKRLLAYSSIENIGIIAIGIGLALLGRCSGRADWVVLGMGGALLHVLNHSLFKPLMFMGAGSLLHATRTRRIDLLGGLGKGMPRTFALFVVGAVAICGLPPLNGFVSELLIYLGMFHAAGAGGGLAREVWIWPALAAPGLACIGALAVSAFVKLVGAVFAGSPRTQAAEHAHDPGGLMLAPMTILAICCVAIGVVPAAVMGLVQRGVKAWAPEIVGSNVLIGSIVPLNWITFAAALLLIGLIGGVLSLRRWRSSHAVPRVGTWDCGFVRPTPRIQYTGSSFGQMLTGLLGWALGPRKAREGLRGIFASPSRFCTDTPDAVLDRALLPAFSAAQRASAWARPIQSGPVQVYLVYILVVLLAMLLFAS